MPDTWFDLAASSRRAAGLLLERGEYRSAVSRAYYAAYARVTHQHARQPGVAFKNDRDGPPHTGKGRLPVLTSTTLSFSSEIANARRPQLVNALERLYSLRIAGDYQPRTVVDQAAAREALSLMNLVFEIV